MALRIRSDIDLKELEKYGFKEWSYHYEAILDEDYGEELIINKSDKSIEISTRYAGTLMDIDLLYDLIKDGLIEKVDE